VILSDADIEHWLNCNIAGESVADLAGGSRVRGGGGRGLTAMRTTREQQEKNRKTKTK